jgi:ABC-type transport system substrate-binding protein
VSSSPAAASASVLPSPAASPAAAAATGAGAAAPSNVAAGSIAVAITPFLNAFDTGTNSAAFRAAFFWPAFDALTWIDGHGTLQPDLATSWSSSGDGMTWTFKLRNDIKFHDGTPLTAKDVVGTLNYYRNPNNKEPVATIFVDVTNVEAPDDQTVTITTRKVVPDLPQAMSLAFILKARDLQPDDQTTYLNYFKTAIGTGPYKFVNWAQDTSLEYQAMPASFVSPRGPAAVQRLVFQNLPDDASRAAALRAGDVQWIYPMPPDQGPSLKNQGFSIATVPAIGNVHVVLKTDTGPTQDVRVRQALNYAVDKDGIIQSVEGGYGRADGQLIGPEVLGYNQDVQPYPYDPAKAKDLLAQAGYPDGFDAGVFEFQTPGSLDNSTAQAIADNLAAVGVTTSFQSVANAPWVQQYYGPESGRTPLWPGSLSWDQTFDAGIALRWWSSDFAPDAGRRWDDQQFDDLYQKARLETDPTARAKLYQQAIVRLHDQAPVIFLWLTDRGAAFDGKKLSWNGGLFADMWTKQLQAH